MFASDFLGAKFAAGLQYEDYVRSGTPAQVQAWNGIYERAALTPEQKRLVQSFVREMHVIVVSGIWCGDCSQQCPLMARIAEANPERVKLRFVDRDQHTDLSKLLRINEGARVPVLLFLAEDDALVSIYGDRTLARYRALAARQLGPSCPVPGAPIAADELAATLQDWLNEFERAQLVLRLSARLRKKHGD